MIPACTSFSCVNEKILPMMNVTTAVTMRGNIAKKANCETKAQTIMLMPPPQKVI
jgi:hypothetical protein